LVSTPTISEVKLCFIRGQKLKIGPQILEMLVTTNMEGKKGREEASSPCKNQLQGWLPSLNTCKPNSSIMLVSACLLSSIAFFPWTMKNPNQSLPIYPDEAKGLE
jgi:hypothetical protein